MRSDKIYLFRKVHPYSGPLSIPRRARLFAICEQTTLHQYIARHQARGRLYIVLITNGQALYYIVLYCLVNIRPQGLKVRLACEGVCLGHGNQSTDNDVIKWKGKNGIAKGP